jgi:pyridoxine 5-phosphate synthase
MVAARRFFSIVKFQPALRASSGGPYISNPASVAYKMIKLGVNIDHVATLRQARYRGQTKGEPNPVEAAIQCVEAGAHGITAHLREDRRHILDQDIQDIRDAINVRFNFEMANVPEMVDLAIATKPEIVCLVPENREEITTEGGLNVSDNIGSLTETASRLNDHGIEVSLFIDPDPAQVEAASKTKSQFIELHTGAYAEHADDPARCSTELERLNKAANFAEQSGLRVNAGHGLNYENLVPILDLPHLEELNIGHSIVSRAVFSGITSAVKEMLTLMEGR